MEPKSTGLLKIVVCAVLAPAFASCSNNSPPQRPDEYKYKIEKEGAPDVKEEFELKDVRSLIVTQRYTVLAYGTDAAAFHFLVLRIERYMGDKLVEAERAVQIPIKNGSGLYNCTNRQSLNPDQTYDDLKATICKFSAIGTIKVNNLENSNLSQ